MIFFYRYCFSIFCLTIILSCSTPKKINESEYIPTPESAFSFHTDAELGEILDLAKEDNKVVFVDIYAEWCLPCKLMDEEVFSDQKLGEYFRDNFISYKVDAEKDNGPDLVLLYDIRAYPTLLFLDHNGRILVRKLGAAFHTEMYRLAEEALSRLPE